MADQEIGLVKFLEQRKLWLQNEIRQTDIALSALRTESLQPKQNHSLATTTDRMKWSPKIDELFKNYDGELTLNAICEKLVEMGMQQAKEKSYKASINACLSRKVKQGKLRRVRPSVYCKKQADEVPETTGTSS